MKPKTGKEYRAELHELRQENEQLRAEIKRLGVSDITAPHPIMDCAWCGELKNYGHDCRTK